MQDLKSLISEIFENESLISAVLSSPRNKQVSSKIAIRPLLIKGKIFYQWTEQKNNQAIHNNLSGVDSENKLLEQCELFKQIFIYTNQADYHILIDKKLQPKILKKAPTKTSLPLSHNREKNYLLQDGTKIPFLIELGIMNQEGKVYSQKRDKFRQINRFLEMVDDVIDYFKDTSTLHIVDFGCGKAYLTFALYHYLKWIKGFNFKITGLDLKQDVIENCQHLTEQLNFQNLQFILGDINQFQTKEPVDMVVSLHACDTATDAVLEKAVRWEAKVILSVPCCQHELYSQVQNQELVPLLKHGILKERFAALATDAARAQLLEVLGYQTQLLEFIDMEHTPKNLLIRAVRKPQTRLDPSAWQTYLAFKKALHIDPSLERRFHQELYLI